MADIQVSEFQVHIRFDGRSYEFSSVELDLGDLSTNDQVRDRVAQRLGIEPRQLSNYVVERAENSNITIRPQAVFGEEELL